MLYGRGRGLRIIGLFGAPCLYFRFLFFLSFPRVSTILTMMFTVVTMERMAMGSSPHARGTPLPDSGDFHAMRIIPACAGNTCGLMVSWTLARAHPRMRGEHGLTVRDTKSGLGSSPHARGTL